MRNTITILGKSDGNPKTGYTVSIHAYSTGTAGYSGPALFTFTDNNDGSYYVDVTLTTKGTIVIVKSGSTSVIVPSNYIGHIFQGDNQPSLKPGGTT